MKRARSKRRVLRVPDEIIALRGERFQNIWTSGRHVPATRLFFITSWLALLVAPFQITTTLAAGIAVGGAKDHLHLGSRSRLVFSPPDRSALFARSCC